MAVGGGGSNVKGFRFFCQGYPGRPPWVGGSLTGRSWGRMSAWEIKVRRVGLLNKPRTSEEMERTFPKIAFFENTH